MVMVEGENALHHVKGRGIVRAWGMSGRTCLGGICPGEMVPILLNPNPIPRVSVRRVLSGHLVSQLWTGTAPRIIVIDYVYSAARRYRPRDILSTRKYAAPRTGSLVRVNSASFHIFSRGNLCRRYLVDSLIRHQNNSTIRRAEAI